MMVSWQDFGETQLGQISQMSMYFSYLLLFRFQFVMFQALPFCFLNFFISFFPSLLLPFPFANPSSCSTPPVKKAVVEDCPSLKFPPWLFHTHNFHSEQITNVFTHGHLIIGLSSLPYLLIRSKHGQNSLEICEPSETLSIWNVCLVVDNFNLKYQLSFKTIKLFLFAWL